MNSKKAGETPSGFSRRQQYRYYAFISYRHVEPDLTWAKWLHHVLETYRVPKRIQQQAGAPASIKPVFRDEEELAASANLSKEIDEALVDSHFLIVVCSSNTPGSVWINREVERFQEMGRQERILVLLIEGEPREAFPQALYDILRNSVGSGESTSLSQLDVEPLAADVRKRAGESLGYLKRQAKLRILATLLGCSFDDLRRRDQDRRNNRLLSIGVALVLLLVGISSLAAFALIQKREAERNLEMAQLENYSYRISLAQKAWAESDLLSMRSALGGCPKRFRNWEWGRLNYLTHLDIRTLEGHSASVESVAFSPDGKRIVSSGWDDTIRVWNAETGTEIYALEGENSEPSAIAWSPDGKIIITGTYNLSLRDAKSGQLIRTWRAHPYNIESIAFSPDSRLIITGGGDSALKLWDTETGSAVLPPLENWTRTYSVAFSPDGRWIVSGDKDGAVILWDAKSGGMMRTYTGHNNYVTSVSYSPAHEQIASGSRDKTIKIWDVQNGGEIRTLRGHSERVNSVAYSPDGKRIVSASADKTIHLWNAASGQRIRDLKGHTSSINAVAYSPDGRTIVSGSEDKTIKLWDAHINSEVQTLRGRHDNVKVIAFSPDGQQLVSGGWENTVHLWDVRTYHIIKTLTLENEAFVYDVAFSADGKNVMIGYGFPIEGITKVTVWDTQTGRRIRTLDAGKNRDGFSGFSPDAKRFLTYNHTDCILWDTEKGNQVLSLPLGLSGVSSFAFSPDGRQLFAGFRSGLIKVWDLDTGNKIGSVQALDYGADAIAISPDGARFVASGDDHSIILWDAKSGKKIHTMKGHTSPAKCLAFSPDGSRILSGGDVSDRMIKLWDADTGKEIQTFKGHLLDVNAVAFSPSGIRFASGGDYGTIKIWSADPWWDSSSLPGWRKKFEQQWPDTQSSKTSE